MPLVFFMIYIPTRTPPFYAFFLVIWYTLPILDTSGQYPGGLTRCDTLVHFGSSVNHQLPFFLQKIQSGETYCVYSSYTSSPSYQKSCICLSGPSPAQRASPPSTSPPPLSQSPASTKLYPQPRPPYRQPVAVYVVALSGISTVAMGSSCKRNSVSLEPQECQLDEGEGGTYHRRPPDKTFVGLNAPNIVLQLNAER